MIRPYTSTIVYTAFVALAFTACQRESPPDHHVAPTIVPVDQPAAGATPEPTPPPWANCRLDDGAADARALAGEILEHLAKDAPASALAHLTPGGCQYFARLFDTASALDADKTFSGFRDVARSLEPRLRAAKSVLQALELSTISHKIVVDPGTTPDLERVSIALGDDPDPYMLRFDVARLSGRVFLASPPVAHAPLNARYSALDVALAALLKAIDEPRPTAEMLAVSRAVDALSDDPDPAVKTRLTEVLSTFRSSLPELDPATSRDLAIALNVPGLATKSPPRGELAAGEVSPVTDDGSGVSYQDAVTQDGPYAYTVTRALLGEDVFGLERLQLAARIVPSFSDTDGQYRGFKLIGLRPGSLFRALGIRSGDIIVGVDGSPLSNPSDSLKFMEGLRSAKTLEVTIDRRSGPRTLTYTFK